MDTWWQVGLGGARDATNVVPPRGVAASVIVSVGEEHLAALGGSLESIALAKAGIVKDGRPLILGRQPYDVAEKIICNVAASKQAKVIKSYGTGVRHAVLDLQFDHATGAAYQTCDLAVGVPGDEGGSQVFQAKALKLRLLGTHQLDNAATAVCTALSLRKQGWRIPDDCIQHGLESASMLGRFQILSPEEAGHLGCAPFIVILDGAHTRDSGAVLAQSLHTLLPHHNLALVVAMASDKDHRGFASSFLLQGKRPQVVVTTQVLVAGSAERSTPAHLLSQAWTDAAAADAGELGNVEDAPGPGASEEGKQLGLAVRSCSNLESALSEAGAYLKAHFGPEGGIVCVTGSLHAVGGALALLETRQKSQRWVAAEEGNGGGL